MSDPITWYALGRTVVDTETILEAVDTKILTHNLDPSAHGQENESVYEHRAAELLDHVNYTIYNIKMNPAARIYKAIVGTGLEADFDTLQAAIDWANLYGGGIVYVKARTYTQVTDIVLYSNIHIIGEDDDTTILDFGTTNKGVQLVGTSGTHKRNIEIEGINFKDGDLDGDLVWLRYVDNVHLHGNKHTHTFPTTTNLLNCIWMDTGCSRIFIEKNQFLNNNYVISVGTVNKCWILENYFYNCERDAIVGGAASHVIIRNNVFEACRQNALYEGPIFFESDIVNLHIEGNQFINCHGVVISLHNMVRSIVVDNRIDGDADTDYGIVMADCVRCTVVSNNIDNVNYDGINVTTSDKNTFVGNTATNCTGYGVNITNAACDKNVVVGNVLTDNGSGGLNDAGTGTVKDHNAT